MPAPPPGLPRLVPLKAPELLTRDVATVAKLARAEIAAGISSGQPVDNAQAVLAALGRVEAWVQHRVVKERNHDRTKDASVEHPGQERSGGDRPGSTGPGDRSAGGGPAGNGVDPGTDLLDVPLVEPH